MKIPVLPISYGDAQPLLARSAARSRPRLARRAAADVPRRARPGARPSEGRVRLVDSRRSTTSSRGSRAARSRRVGHPRQSPRRLGERRGRPDQRDGRRCWRRRARSASWSKQGGGRSARSFFAPGTPKSRDCSARPNGSRSTPKSSKQKAVAYINSDSKGKGCLGAGGSHSLERFVNEVARDVRPEASKSVWEVLKDDGSVEQARTRSTKKDTRRERTCA